jgi:hypothetical protein
MAVAFSTIGRLLVTTGENIGKVFEVKPGAPQVGLLSIDMRSLLSPPKERVDAAVFSPEATLLARYCRFSSNNGEPIRRTDIP